MEKFYSGLQALALEETEAEWDENKDDSTWPSDELLGRAEEELEELWEVCPDPVKAARGGGGGGGKRKADAVEKKVKVKSEPAAKKGKGKKKVKVEEDEDEEEDKRWEAGAGVRCRRTWKN